MNILILQEKMGDNIKKVANLFVISDFCSIFAENSAEFGRTFKQACKFCSRLLYLFIHPQFL